MNLIKEGYGANLRGYVARRVVTGRELAVTGRPLKSGAESRSSGLAGAEEYSR